MFINLIPDSSVENYFGSSWASSSFWNALTYAADTLDSLIQNNITINLDVGWGEIKTNPGSVDVSGLDIGESTNFGQTSYTYGAIINYLQSDNLSPIHSVFMNLPSQDPVSGSHAYLIGYSEQKVLGIISGSGSEIDGSIGFNPVDSYNFNINDPAVSNEYDFVGIAQHEITEAMGRILGENSTTPHGLDLYSILNLFRYSSVGTIALNTENIFGQYSPYDGSTYFSLNGGTTSIENFSTSSRGLNDWASSAGNDAFDAVAKTNVENPITTADIQVMDALGYDMTSEPTISAGITLTSPFLLAAGETLDITSSGTIDGTGTLSALYAGPSAVDVVVTNQGSIVLTNHYISSVTFSSAIGIGVDLEAGGSVSNAAGASIVGYNAGIVISGAPGTVSNAGSIGATGMSDWGVDLAAGGSVSNATGGTISGALVGVYINGAAGTVSNAAGASIDGGGIGIHIHNATGTVINGGNISANGFKAIGVEFDAGGNISNQSNATISGIYSGIQLNGSAGSVSNAGTISATGTQGVGAFFGNGGSVANDVNGQISGDLTGVGFYGASGSVSNAGTITGTNASGIVLDEGGSVTNSSGGSISGKNGVLSFLKAGTVTNSGTISAISSSGTLITAGVSLETGGSVVNASGGSIYGGVIISAPGTVTNAGTISSSGPNGAGIVLLGGGTATNAGAITASGTAGAGIDLGAAGGNITNTGDITANGPKGIGILLRGGGNVTDAAGATISGNVAVQMAGEGGRTLVNAGTIESAAGATGVRAGLGNLDRGMSGFSA